MTTIMADTEKFNADQPIFPPGTQDKFVPRCVVRKSTLVKLPDEEFLRTLAPICSEDILASLRRVYGEEAVQRALRGS